MVSVTVKSLLERSFFHYCLLPPSVCSGDEEGTLPKFQVSASHINLLSSNTSALVNATSIQRGGSGCVCDASFGVIEESDVITL